MKDELKHASPAELDSALAVGHAASEFDPGSFGHGVHVFVSASR
jgi:hypothetical protein